MTKAARALYEEGLALAREIGDKRNIASYLEGLAQVVSFQGEQLWAARLWGAAEALREASNTSLPAVDHADYERSVAAARTQLGEKAFAAAWSEGRTMPLEQILAAKGTAEILALIPVEPSSAPPVRMPSTPPAGLTTREMDVLRLLAQGLTSTRWPSGSSSGSSPSISMYARSTASWESPLEPLRPGMLWSTTWCETSPSFRYIPWCSLAYSKHHRY